MAVMRNLCNTEKPFLRDKTGRDCFITDSHSLFAPFIYDLRIFTLPFAVNITLGIIDNIFLKSSLVRSFEIIINIQSANSHKLRFRFIPI
jgi:hypothetical protein